MTLQDIHKKTFCITFSGELITLKEWQKCYNLEVGSDQVGKHFAIATDHKLKQDLIEYGKLIICEPLMMVMDEYRLRTGSTKINSFNRSKEKQRLLQQSGYRAALISPHEKFVACDVDTKTPAESEMKAKVLRQISKDLGIKVRIGWRKYLKNGQTFIHMDVCPEYYAEEAIWHENAHPTQWESELTW